MGEAHFSLHQSVFCCCCCVFTQIFSWSATWSKMEHKRSFSHCQSKAFFFFREPVRKKNLYTKHADNIQRSFPLQFNAGTTHFVVKKGPLLWGQIFLPTKDHIVLIIHTWKIEDFCLFMDIHWIPRIMPLHLMKTGNRLKKVYHAWNSSGDQNFHKSWKMDQYGRTLL